MHCLQIHSPKWVERKSDGYLSETENKIHNLPQTSAFVRFGVIDSAGEIIGLNVEEIDGV